LGPVNHGKKSVVDNISPARYIHTSEANIISYGLFAVIYGTQLSRE
jgi:hypothetical protein